jgi:hypothetical protein
MDCQNRSSEQVQEMGEESMRCSKALAAVVVVAAAAFGVVSSGGAYAAPVAEDRATKDDYELDTQATTSTLKVGEDGRFVLKITPKNGKKVHPDAPLEVSLKESGGIKLQKQKLGRADVKDKADLAPEVVGSFRAAKAGPASIEANISFFLCTEAWCQRLTDRVQIAITVE